MAAHQALFGDGNVRLVGLMVTPIVVPNLPPTEVLLPSFIDAQIEANRRQVAAAEASFRAACERAGTACEWRTSEVASAYVSGRAGAMARTADLIIAPKCRDEEAIGQHEVDQVVFESGRPVLALPLGWQAPKIGARVLIAWNGKREAARAAFDALPLLGRAEAVRVISVREGSHEQLGQFTPGDDLAATLARHDIHVDTASVHCERSSVAEEIRTHAREYGADLLVMGCYGHSRFREMILGGVTRDLLREPPLPVLLSS
jgi:nucleotide-binding universal stress UspA family protein